jgi:ABC-type branched-subunit amino acid transport system permease subunit
MSSGPLACSSRRQNARDGRRSAEAALCQLLDHVRVAGRAPAGGSRSCSAVLAAIRHGVTVDLGALAISSDILISYTGMVSFGHSAFASASA